MTSLVVAAAEAGAGRTGAQAAGRMKESRVPVIERVKE
jgi:hypothetical protein